MHASNTTIIGCILTFQLLHILHASFLRSRCTYIVIPQFLNLRELQEVAYLIVMEKMTNVNRQDKEKEILGELH
jgi:hypothetical protein